MIDGGVDDDCWRFDEGVILGGAFFGGVNNGGVIAGGVTDVGMIVGVWLMEV